MDLLIILTYAGFCIAIFKIFNIPLNKWTVPTAVLGGIVIVGGLVLTMNYNHPYTSEGGQFVLTTPIVPGVRGRVIEVDAKPNQQMKQGDILFKLDPTPFQAAVDSQKAALEQAKQQALTLVANYKNAQANTIKAQAERDRTYREFQRYAQGYKRGAFTKNDADNRQQYYRSAEAALAAAKAQEESARLAAESEVNGESTIVANARAQLEKAEFNLEQTIVRAPTDGYATQIALREGMMAVPLPLSPLMTYVNKEDEQLYVAAFRQNSSQRLKKGFEAELIFKAIPGKTFQGEVESVLPTIGESQVQAQGRLYTAAGLHNVGQVLVLIRIKDDISEYNLPQGTNANVAVYSDSFEHVSVMRKVLLRMKSWQNYLYLDH